MKCPNCGYEHPNAITEGNRFREAVFKRMADYGFSEQMNPQKYQAYESIRKTIQIRLMLVLKPGGCMTKEQADKCIAALDEILPRKAPDHV